MMKINPINTIECSPNGGYSVECVICEYVLELDVANIAKGEAKLTKLGWGSFHTLLGQYCPVACPACLGDAQELEAHYQPYLQTAKNLLGTSIDDCKSSLQCMLNRNPENVINVMDLTIQQLELSHSQKTKLKLFQTFHDAASKILNE